ncbi:hypothetical protein GCM10018780_77850 [Streptomyces lanatus]|nr:hypothetical protein GCM10018780_77850 [Streptomyces lanatus]
MPCPAGRATAVGATEAPAEQGTCRARSYTGHGRRSSAGVPLVEHRRLPFGIDTKSPLTQTAYPAALAELIRAVVEGRGAEVVDWCRGYSGVDHRSRGTWTEGVVPAGSEPKVAKNRWHFDLKVGRGHDVPLDVRAQGVKATVERLVKAGATVLRIKDEPDMGLYATAVQDPEGNEFDVV